MRKYSAQYALSPDGRLLKRPVITTDNDGTIISLEDTRGDLRESASLEFYNGIIVPGFVNAHCHLELSSMKGVLPQGSGLGEFITGVREKRSRYESNALNAALSADSLMSREGIVLCGDISNSALTVPVKEKSSIQYVTFVEVFGIDPSSAPKRYEEGAEVLRSFKNAGLEAYITPHSFYSVSSGLHNLLIKNRKENEILSIHFMESEEEEEILKSGRGPVMDSYARMGFDNRSLELPRSHTDALRDLTGRTGKLILVHNTFVTESTVRKALDRGNTYFCLCPSSNKYITGSVPPADMMKTMGCDIILGTDSLASTGRLSILGEMKIIQASFPSIPLGTILTWATLKGAEALGKESIYGSFTPGKRPGMVLLENLDLNNFRLLPETNTKIIGPTTEIVPLFFSRHLFIVNLPDTYSMATFLFDKIVFGPVKSRRLGRSLGINLLPSDSKFCNFNCIYCECGWTDRAHLDADALPAREDVKDALEKFLSAMPAGEPTIDAITFAGNGEPTLHPEFIAIIDDTILLRNRFCPEVKIAILSNGSTTGDPAIRASLSKADQNILKLDSAFDSTVIKHNMPAFAYKGSEIVENYKLFKGNLIIQTLFLQGVHNGQPIDNSTEEEVSAWLKIIEELRPCEVMIYTISRDTPLGNDLIKVSPARLNEIAARVRSLGIDTSVST